MNTLTNLVNRIKVADFELTKANGLWVAYDLDGIEKNLIETDEQNICELLKGIGVIEGYKLVDGLLCVVVERETRYGLADVPALSTSMFEDFIDDFELSQKDAIDIVVNHERGLIGKQLREEGNEMMDALMEM